MINAATAQLQGLTGQGVRIGIVDSGIKRTAPAVAGRVVASYAYIDPARNNLNVDDVVGHGTAVASLAAGAAVGAWPGGVAKGAELVSARIIGDTRPSDDGSGQGNAVNGPIGVAQVHQDLINNGVKVMNNSWGGLYWTNLGATAQIAAEYRPFITSNGGLVVFATGNEGRADPSSLAALPSQPGSAGSRPAADLERGWLAVTAVDSVNPNQRAAYANACGVAARYCLAAPGSAVFPDPASPDSNPTLVWNYGTSFAAPLVSGAAALVWQKYPYMSNDQVRQVLLGTATDIGAPGVDPVFGYGLLNVARAINGPGRFDWGDVTATVDTASSGSLWSNPISGSGGLVKLGGGLLALSADNSYSGGTRVEQGTLSLRGATLRSGASTLPGATLQFASGAARVVGTVDNGGTVALTTANTSPSIEGNYVQQASARLMIALGVNALQISGSAQLAGEVVVNGVISGYVLANGSRQDLLHTAGGVSGVFAGTGASTTGNSGLSLLNSHFGYDATNAWLVLDQVSVTAAAASAQVDAAGFAAAQRVQQAFAVLDTDATLRGSAFGAAASVQQVGGGNAGLAATLDSLSGRSHALANGLTFDSIDMSRRALATRFGQVQGRPLLGGSWRAALGEAGQGSFAGNAAETRGWMVGQDMPMGRNGVFGVAFGETRNQGSHGFGGDQGRDRQAQAQLYAGWGFGRGYALAQVGSGQFQRQLDRQLLLGASALGASSRYGGTFSTASLETGLRLGGARASLTPYVGASYMRLDSDGLSEQGGAGFGLRAGSSVASRSQALTGVRSERQWRRWTLRGYAEWKQTLAQSGQGLQASFVGVDAWVPLIGAYRANGSGLFGLALDAWAGPAARLSFGVDQRIGGGQDLHQVALRYNAGF
ncbi:MAG: Extracellular serine protease [Stenotrophomonas maltophilia]|uniref:Extracellular serine protease n=1 Tax=Stenotrophomonas maltophilia TaxID=40324 RepID=A0A7V8FHR8_STEMA|nr:MAG: Extracellular serine protease [Stenotrophomonas maltophilia]